MKRVLIVLMFGILITSLASAEIIFKEQPKELYNLGEIVKVPAKVATVSGIEEFLSMKLICNGIESEIHKQYISLPPGGEQEINAAIPLATHFIGRSTGECTIKASLGGLYVLSKEFKISNLIFIELETEKSKFAPEENIIVKGTAIKENGENVQGFIDLSIVEGDESISASDTVKNGYFFLNISLPKDTKAGQYLTRLNIYEKDGSGNISNTGFVDYNILVTQVPTSLEIMFEKSKVIPGENLKIKAILHDQSGEKIESEATITIINENGKKLEVVDIATEEYFEYPIEYNQLPCEWKIEAVSNKITSEETFNISENEYAEIDIINRTVIITNKGNVPYNETVLIKIGNETVEIDTYIEVDKVQKYSLSAPEGEYEIEVRSGENKVRETVMLTGNAIRVEEISGGIFSVIRFPFVWIFIIGILGFTIFIIHKKGYKRSFFGYITKRKEKKVSDAPPIDYKSLINPKNKAELSLSIKGDKQDVSLICLKIKNEGDVEKNDIAKGELHKIVEIAEEHKTAVYKNQNNIFFIFAPIKTKTFKNQKTAVQVAQKTKEILDKYNKLAKQKIDFGISLNYGTIVAKQEKELKFMSLGTLVTTARRLANLSEGEIYLSKEMNEKVLTDVKTDKHEKNGHTVYTVKEIRQKGADNKKFISNFIKRLEKENKEKAEKEKKEK